MYTDALGPGILPAVPDGACAEGALRTYITRQDVSCKSQRAHSTLLLATVLCILRACLGFRATDDEPSLGDEDWVWTSRASSGRLDVWTHRSEHPSGEDQ